VTAPWVVPCTKRTHETIMSNRAHEVCQLADIPTVIVPTVRVPVGRARGFWG
jgi:hypothetical protein